MQTMIRICLAASLLVTVALLLSTSAVAQERYVRLLARRMGSEVMLRWAPSSPTFFQEGRQKGYRVERAPVSEGGSIGEFKPVLDGRLFLPFTKDAFQYLAYTNRGSDSSRLVYRSFAYSVLYDTASQTLTSPQSEEAQQMQFGFSLLAADRDTTSALALGLSYQDVELERGQRYAYRITLESRKDDPLASDTVVVGVEAYRPPRRRNVVVVEEGDGVVTLKWPADLGYSAYMINRSDNGGRRWVPLASAPMITLITGDSARGDEFHRDTALTNYRTYRYRLYGYTAFADEELVADVVATPKDLTPPNMPFNVRAEEQRPGVVAISWSISEPPSADLASIYVARGTEDRGPFTRLSGKLGADARTYIDSTGGLAGANYYVVQTVDTAGNVAESYSAYLVLTDSTPPAAPVLLEGSIDSAGVVTLVFERPPDRDYRGYRLLRANDTTHEFGVVAERLTGDSLDVSGERIHKDTIEIRSLTPNVYYRMYALDFNHNESKPSALLRLKRPDVLAPVAPVITGYLVTDSSMIIDYVSSSSDDVARQALLRKPSSSERWDTVSVLTAGLSRVEDGAALPSQMYDYAVIAIDASGLRSDLSNVVSGRRYDVGTRPAVNGVRAQYDSVARVVTLSWDYRDIAEDHSFVIYRTVGDRMQSLAVVPGSSKRQFMDRVGSSAVDIRYAIKVVTVSGAESVLSQSVSINQR
jgi:hypothetical protein